MWKYTEDGSLDTEDVVVRLDHEGKVIKEVSKKDEKANDAEKGQLDIYLILVLQNRRPTMAKPGWTSSLQRVRNENRRYRRVNILFFSYHLPLPSNQISRATRTDGGYTL